jgi:hypothetical protein
VEKSRKRPANNKNHGAEESLLILANLIARFHLKKILPAGKEKTLPADTGNTKND